MNNTFETSDLNLITILQFKGYKYESTNKVDQSRVMFSYESTPELRKTVDGYFARELLLEPYELLQTLRAMKSKVHSIKENIIKENITN